jgi:hypothetical protein
MTRRTALIAFMVGVALVGAGSVARAHHAFAAEFDVNKPIKFEGKLIKWDMVNPHSWFHMEIKGEKWMIEGGSPNQLIRQGVTSKTVPPGRHIPASKFRCPIAAACATTPRCGLSPIAFRQLCMICPSRQSDSTQSNGPGSCPGTASAGLPPCRQRSRP